MRGSSRARSAVQEFARTRVQRHVDTGGFDAIDLGGAEETRGSVRLHDQPVERTL
jgi:hypothetical protein